MIHPVAAQGFRGDIYEQGRPDYPSEAVSALLAGVDVDGVVVDLGAGTGKLTRAIARTRVLAIDPLFGMLTTLKSVSPDAAAVAATAESMPVRSGTADAVVCGSAFHWFDHERALPEIHRVLRPEGLLGLIWNRRDVSVPWVKEVWDRVEEHRGSTPGHLSGGAWEPSLDASPLFERTGYEEFRSVRRCSIIDRLESTSFIHTLGNDEKEDLFREVRRICGGEEIVDLPYRALVYRYRRRDR